MRRHRARVRLFDRREALRIGGTVAAGGALLGCESLSLPDAILREEVDPITPTPDFYVQSCGCEGSREVDLSSWALSIRGAGEEIGSLGYSEMLALPGREKEHTLQCIGGTPRFPQINNAVWTGLPLPEILEGLGVSVPASAVEIEFLCADGYWVTIPSSDLGKPLWLVWEMNGELLTISHGAPARLLNPGRYGTKNPKWILSMDFIDEPRLGYWEISEHGGWSNEATYQPNGYILSPPSLTPIGRSGVRLLGTAFAGSDPIELVEITVDGADRQEAEITYSPGPDVWTLWRYEWIPPGPGTYRVQVHVTTASGATSNPDPRGNGDPLDGYDGGMEIELEVS